MVKCCLGTWRAEGGSPHTDHKGYVLPETTTMHSLPYTTLAQRKRDNMYKKKRKGAQREKPDKQAKRPETSKQEDSLVSHNNRGTKPTTTTSIRGDLLVRPSKGEPKLICRHAGLGPKRSGTGFQLVRAGDHLFHHEEKTDFPAKRKERMPNEQALNTRQKA